MGRVDFQAWKIIKNIPFGACPISLFFDHICKAPPKLFLMRTLKFLLLCLLAHSLAFAQEIPYYTVVAKAGDGIFSLLRKEGLDPVKHYGEFLELNAAVLGGNSLLKVGAGYKVPEADDNYRNTGLLIKTDQGGERPIFDLELAGMSPKSENLKDAVYYLINENEGRADTGFMGDIVKALAAELMIHGAKVYVLGTSDSPVDGALAQKETQRLGGYVDAVNKRFLQNSGKYQRVLLIRSRELDGSLPIKVALYHDNKNEKGQRLALNIQNVLKRNSVSQATVTARDMVLRDKGGLYLSNNILPAMSLLTLENTGSRSDGNIVVGPHRERFAGWISHGIMNDYAELEIED